MRTSPERPERCPECGSDRIVRIVYGLPTSDVDAADSRGELLIGGCMVGPGSPRWGCGACRWEPAYDESLEAGPIP